MLGAQIKQQPGRRDFYTRNRVLRDRSLLTLDLDRKIIALQHRSSDLHDFRQLGGLEPMVFVIGHLSARAIEGTE